MRGTSSFQILSEKCGQQIWLAKFQLVVIRQAHFGSLRIALEHPPFVDLFRIGTRGIPLLCWIVVGYMPWSDSWNDNLNITWFDPNIPSSTQISFRPPRWMDPTKFDWIELFDFRTFSKKSKQVLNFRDSRQWAVEVFFSRCCQGAFVWRTASISFSCALDEFWRKTLPEDVVDHKTWWLETIEQTSGIFYVLQNVEPTFFLCWPSVFIGYEFGHKSQALM